ncbi:alkylglycerol monooxygenase isoform X1 [Meriones unguiculatus]|uniref:alkylglycerol monooxygenase isoform X1 n=1 Tax=Meriones unguiculatus TaxID=10047 RepID=UPI00293F55E4|nr:alkylglycerol monooxygenase isoform X1 [Meriones unguiculatus]
MKSLGAQDNVSVSQGIRMMFYMMKPSETAFQTVEEVPDYVKKATPLFISLILLELVVSWIARGKPPGRLDGALTSMSAGVVSRLPSLFFRSLEVTSYIYIWENYRLSELPWDSPWTWYLTFLGVDFGYYWFHRMAHEINILWAAHQAHHSSEDYNLCTALRQSVLQQYSSWIFYCPLALFIPPSVFAVHIQFNLLYQFWIHTEVIRSLGPLELVLNTPSHHRVHHGRNRYCIDKNYAGTLIIWDRIFGTFEAEKEQVIYGLTHPIDTFEPFKVQFHHLFYIWTTFWATPGFCHKFSVLFKGPGWSPGKPRLGLSEDIPEVTGQEVPLSSPASLLLKMYAVLQFVVMLAFYEETFADTEALSQVTIFLRVLFIILTLTSIGFLLDQRPEAALLETLRCLMFLTLYRFGHLQLLIPSLSFVFEIFFSVCIAFWGVRSMKQLASVSWKKP